MTRQRVVGWTALAAGLILTVGAVLYLLTQLGGIKFAIELDCLDMWASCPPVRRSEPGVDWLGFWVLLLVGLSVSLAATYALLRSRSNRMDEKSGPEGPL